MSFHSTSGAKLAFEVLIYDDAGDYAGLQAAERIAETGARVEVMTRDRSFASEVMAMSLTPFIRALQKRDVTFTVTFLAPRSCTVMKDGVGVEYGGAELFSAPRHPYTRYLVDTRATLSKAFERVMRCR